MNILGAILFVFLFLVRLEQGGFGLPLAAQSALVPIVRNLDQHWIYWAFDDQDIVDISS